VANNNLPEITSVTSEALQAQIRTLLPSQQGFGNDLMAQNVIVPIIDLTRTAEGSSVGTNLQTAIAFGSQTAISADNTTVVVANTAGFYRLIGVAITQNQSGADNTVTLQMSDGLSTKNIWATTTRATGNATDSHIQIDLTFYLNAGESLSVIASGTYSEFDGSVRQIADVNGNLVNPSGFNPQ
jgi:hypothetical protein